MNKKEFEEKLKELKYVLNLYFLNGVKIINLLQDNERQFYILEWINSKNTNYNYVLYRIPISVVFQFLLNQINLYELFKNGKNFQLIDSENKTFFDIDKKGKMYNDLLKEKLGIFYFKPKFAHCFPKEIFNISEIKNATATSDIFIECEDFSEYIKYEMLFFDNMSEAEEQFKSHNYNDNESDYILIYFSQKMEFDIKMFELIFKNFKKRNLILSFYE